MELPFVFLGLHFRFMHDLSVLPCLLLRLQLVGGDRRIPPNSSAIETLNLRNFDSIARRKASDWITVSGTWLDRPRGLWILSTSFLDPRASIPHSRIRFHFFFSNSIYARSFNLFKSNRLNPPVNVARNRKDSFLI